MTTPPNIHDNGHPISGLLIPGWSNYGLHVGSSVTSTPNGDFAVLIGSVHYVYGGEPWRDGTYCLEVEAITFDPNAALSGVWLKQKTLITRRSGTFTANAQYNEVVIPGNTTASLNATFPGGDVINLFISSRLDGAKACARWTLEHVG